jgi:release factor glutamine methyltransferase
MASGNKKAFFDDFTFLVDENVYEPAEDSFLFAENLPVEKLCRTADVGTGCGILGIVAAKEAKEVLAIDINPHAVCCALENAKLNGVNEKITFLQGDLLNSVSSTVKFDAILFNAPYLPVERKTASWLEYSWAGGRTGRGVIDRFIDEAADHLAPEGQILLMQSSLSDVDKTLQRCSAKGLNSKVIASRGLPFFETILLIKAVWGKNKGTEKNSLFRVR